MKNPYKISWQDEMESMKAIGWDEGFKASLKSVIGYLKGELATQKKRTAGKTRLVAKLNTIEATVIKTIINALEEGVE